jgi:riboflavin-specific deaminase-like protein
VDMRRLIPPEGEESLEDLYTEVGFPDPPPGRPHVFLHMVMSVDGAASVDGGTAGMGGAADRGAFSRLRAACDVILVGAETARAEDYGPPRTVDADVEGEPARPRVAVVTASGRLDPGARLFSDPRRRPLVVAPQDAPGERLAALEDVADVLRVGSGRVDLGSALALLLDEGIQVVLCEGGPTLNAALLRAGLVDEIFLTVSPQIVGTSPHRIVDGDLPGGPLSLRLTELREHGGELLLRYAVTPG